MLWNFSKIFQDGIFNIKVSRSRRQLKDFQELTQDWFIIEVNDELGINHHPQCLNCILNFLLLMPIRVSKNLAYLSKDFDKVFPLLFKAFKLSQWIFDLIKDALYFKHFLNLVQILILRLLIDFHIFIIFLFDKHT